MDRHQSFRENKTLIKIINIIESSLGGQLFYGLPMAPGPWFAHPPVYTLKEAVHFLYSLFVCELELFQLSLKKYSIYFLQSAYMVFSTHAILILKYVYVCVHVCLLLCIHGQMNA